MGEEAKMKKGKRGEWHRAPSTTKKKMKMKIWTATKEQIAHVWDFCA
jgi:hypothetical protein